MQYLGNYNTDQPLKFLYSMSRDVQLIELSKAYIAG
jgi:hypothetical protein